MTDTTVSKSLLDEELSEKIIKYSNQFYNEIKILLLMNKTDLETLADYLTRKDVLQKSQGKKLKEVL